jgi:hypothetical protein
MSTPTVIEITRRPEPVVHDPFIDDLRRPIRPDAPALQRKGDGPTSRRLAVRRVRYQSHL